MLRRLDNLFIGLALGIFLPIVGIFVYYIFTYRVETSFSGFIDYFKSVHLFVAYISLACYMTNLPLFFLFIWKDKYQGARGVLFATIMYTAWVVYEKFL
ncbi:MAG: hypothetical protein NT084_12280 [Bacteroidetes bacterium]|nr:hypothetical protein [Bacteroidota bacterium]